MAIEIVDLPINSMVIFHRFLYVYQRVPGTHMIYPTVAMIHPCKAWLMNY
jgi:hypothetical protein